MVVFERAHSLWSSRFCSVAAGQHFPSTHGLLRIGQWVSALSRRGIRNADASSGWRRSVSQTSQTHSTCVVERIVLGVFGNTTSDTCTTALLWLSVTHTEFKNDVKQTVPVWKGLTDLYFILFLFYCIGASVLNPVRRSVSGQHAHCSNQLFKVLMDLLCNQTEAPVDQGNSANLRCLLCLEWAAVYFVRLKSWAFVAPGPSAVLLELVQYDMKKPKRRRVIFRPPHMIFLQEKRPSWWFVLHGFLMWSSKWMSLSNSSLVVW